MERALVGVRARLGEEVGYRVARPHRLAVPATVAQHAHVVREVVVVEPGDGGPDWHADGYRVEPIRLGHQHLTRVRDRGWRRLQAGRAGGEQAHGQAGDHNMPRHGQLPAASARMATSARCPAAANTRTKAARSSTSAMVW